MSELVAIGCSQRLRTNLFPLSSSSNKANNRIGNPRAAGDEGSVVDELVGAKFQQKEGGDEGGNVVSDNVGVGHGRVN